jgi:signal transduction histidine kinase/CheY-like chemotaxis protein
MTNLEIFASLGERENLDELRETIIRYLVVITILLGAFESWFTAWLTLPSDPLQSNRFLIWLSLSLLGILASSFLDRSPIVSRHLFVWGSLAWLLAAIWVFPAPWVPFLTLLGVLTFGTLVPGSELVSTIAAIILTSALVRSGQRIYPLAELFLALCMGLFIAYVLRWTLLTALAWAWSSQQRAEQLLQETREHRAVVSTALKSLEISSITQRKIQDELVVARKQADEARRMKERFAANISHELRTPLNLILGFSEVMYKSPETYGKVSWTPTLRRDIYQVYRSSEHLLEMIDDVLDLSHYEILDFSLSKELVPISTTILEAVEISRDLFTGSAVALETDLAPDLPMLEIDVTRIRQVLINLFKNARSFTTEGFVRVAAHMEKESAEKGRVVISVKDTGEGIPKGKLSSVFDEFYQVDESRSRKRQGAGLGLAICKRLVEAHEGSIWVESQEEVGTEFFFALPLPTNKYHLLPISTSDLSEILQVTSRQSLLVVESDPILVGILARRLGDLEIIQVEEVSLLEEYVNRYRPCAVIVNALPGNSQPLKLNGDYSIPIIQVSLPSQAWLAKKLGISTSLIKPVTSNQLLGCMVRYGHVKDILIVDDDREFVQLIYRYLQSSGKEYNVRFAYDGDEGWLSLCQQPPDLVMLDVILPGRDGLEIIEEMKLNPSLAKTEVILITGTQFDNVIKEKYESQIQIQRRGGLSYNQILACIKAIVNVSNTRDRATSPIWKEESINGGLGTGLS